MRSSGAVDEPGRRLSDPPGEDPNIEFFREDAANRISAFVYGNILVMAALIASRPRDLAGPGGLAYVIGIAVSTFVAHVVAESVGLRMHTDAHPRLSTVAREL